MACHVFIDTFNRLIVFFNGKSTCASHFQYRLNFKGISLRYNLPVRCSPGRPASVRQPADFGRLTRLPPMMPKLRSAHLRHHGRDRRSAGRTSPYTAFRFALEENSEKRLLLLEFSFLLLFSLLVC